MPDTNDSEWPIDDGFFGVIEAYSDPAGAAEDAFLDKAIEILDYAQANAPWEDRTGAARAGLDVDVYRESDQVVLELFHTVDYGIFLETIQSGRFAIIMPTLERFAQEVFQAAGGRYLGEEGGDES